MTLDATKSTQTQSGRSRGSGMGSEEISETERFVGYYRNKSRSNIEQVVHKGSLIGSLDGNVIVDASGDFRSSTTGPMTIELQRQDGKKIIEVRYDTNQ